MSKKTHKAYMDDYVNGKGDSPRVTWTDKDKDRLDRIFKRGKYSEDTKIEKDTNEKS